MIARTLGHNDLVPINPPSIKSNVALRRKPDLLKNWQKPDLYLSITYLSCFDAYFK